jgi:hypothetical protein
VGRAPARDVQRRLLLDHERRAWFFSCLSESS